MKRCPICGKEYDGYGNSPEPVLSIVQGKCCDECNMAVVIPARIRNCKRPSSKRNTAETNHNRNQS